MVVTRHIDALIAEHLFGEKPIVRMAASKDGGKSFAGKRARDFLAKYRGGE